METSVCGGAGRLSLVERVDKDAELFRAEVARLRVELEALNAERLRAFYESVGDDDGDRPNDH